MLDIGILFIMGKFKITKVNIKDICVIEPQVYHDCRGFFMESYNKTDFEEEGIIVDFVQDNHSKSTKGVLRGLHFQQHFQQAKLIRVLTGSIFDVVVDIRKNSETFGEWYGIELSSENKKQLYIPKGFAHGFLVLSDIAEVSYKTSEYYHPEDEMGIAWDDKDLNIQWPQIKKDNDKGDFIAKDFIISEKDKKWKNLNEIFG